VNLAAGEPVVGGAGLDDVGALGDAVDDDDGGEERRVGDAPASGVVAQVAESGASPVSASCR